MKRHDIGSLRVPHGVSDLPFARRPGFQQDPGQVWRQERMAYGHMGNDRGERPKT